MLPRLLTSELLAHLANALTFSALEQVCRILGDAAHLDSVLASLVAGEALRFQDVDTASVLAFFGADGGEAEALALLELFFEEAARQALEAARTAGYYSERAAMGPGQDESAMSLHVQLARLSFSEYSAVWNATLLDALTWLWVGGVGHRLAEEMRG